MHFFLQMIHAQNTAPSLHFDPSDGDDTVSSLGYISRPH